MEKLRKEEKRAEAVAACEKQLAIERQVWGDLHDDVVGTLEQLAGLHEEAARTGPQRRRSERRCCGFRENVTMRKIGTSAIACRRPRRWGEP